MRGLYGSYLGRIGRLPPEFTLQWVQTKAATQVPGVEVEWLPPADTMGERELVSWTNLDLIG